MIKISISILLLSFFLLLETSGQNLTKSDSVCNRQGADRSISRLIPIGVCIPNGYTATRVINDFDLDKDGLNDLAIRFIKFPLRDGNMENYALFKRLNENSFKRINMLQNISVPYIKSATVSYRETHPFADSLIRVYPITRKLEFDSDTLFIDLFIPSYYGKTHVFIYNSISENWHLIRTNYWVGNVPAWIVNNADLNRELLHKRINLESTIPEKRIAIDKFDLLESHRQAINEESAHFMNNYDIFKIGEKIRKQQN